MYNTFNLVNYHSSLIQGDQGPYKGDATPQDRPKINQLYYNFEKGHPSYRILVKYIWPSIWKQLLKLFSHLDDDLCIPSKSRFVTKSLSENSSDHFIVTIDKYMKELV